MNANDILVILILAILVLMVIRGLCQAKHSRRSNMQNDMQNDMESAEDVVMPEDEESREYMSNVVEGMAPLNFGTFYDNYPRGECRTGRFLERKPCEVGNCPLGTTVSDQQFCRIQCAQDPDAKERQDCYEFCMRNVC